jgi:hypothetical protein
MVSVAELLRSRTHPSATLRMTYSLFNAYWYKSVIP